MSDVQDSVYNRACHLISRIYDLPEADQAQFIERECAGDSALRDEVRWMFEALRSPHDATFLDQSPVGATATAGSRIQVPTPRDYEIIRTLGEGGMGVVYLARRSDGEYTQEVALKLLNILGLTQPAVIAHFIRERKILAELNHPNIAHLVDGGTLPDGRPFLAMEYVDGQRIDEYCRVHDLSVAARLALFVKVCNAVQFAHQHLIVHRDIKPDNILVTAEGEPKLLDFGIARLLDAPGAVIAQHTVTGMRMMTLAYASPEQVAGKSATVSTDVFSLGVVLYELLALRRPWPDSNSVVELARSISEWDPTAPSASRRFTRTGAEAKNDVPRDLRIAADLDAIVLKALRKEPAQRYATVQDFADDLDNYLQSRPVTARRGHLTYRISKFVVRHRFAVTWSAVLLTLIIAFAANREIQLERTRIEQAKAEQLYHLMIDLFSVAQPERARGKDITARELLQRGAEQTRHSLEGQPEVRAAFLQTIGGVLDRLGLSSEGKPLLEESLAIRAATGHADPLVQAQNLITLYDVDMSTGQAQSALDRVTQARKLLEDAGLENTRVYVFVLTSWATASRTLGTPIADLIPVYERALKLVRSVTTEPWDELRVQSIYATALRGAGRQKDAYEIVTAALASKSVADDPDHPLVTSLRKSTVSYLTQSGQLDQAVATLELALQADRTTYGEQHPTTAGDLFWLGALQIRQEHYAQAETTLRHSVGIIEALGANTSTETLIRARSNLAAALKMQKKYDEAWSMQDAIEKLALEKFGNTSEYYEGALGEKAGIAYARKDYATAETLDKRALEIVAGIADRWEDDAQIRRDLAQVYLDTGRPKDALALLLTAAQTREQHAGRKAPDTQRVLPDLAAALAATGDVERANTLFEETLPATKQFDGECGESTRHVIRRWQEAAQASAQVRAAPALAESCPKMAAE